MEKATCPCEKSALGTKTLYFVDTPLQLSVLSTAFWKLSALSEWRSRRSSHGGNSGSVVTSYTRPAAARPLTTPLGGGARDKGWRREQRQPSPPATAWADRAYDAGDSWPGPTQPADPNTDSDKWLGMDAKS